MASVSDIHPDRILASSAGKKRRRPPGPSKSPCAMRPRRVAPARDFVAAMRAKIALAAQPVTAEVKKASRRA